VGEGGVREREHERAKARGDQAQTVVAGRVDIGAIDRGESTQEPSL